MTEDTPMSLRADLDLAAMTRDDEGRWRADTTDTALDRSRAREVVSWVLWTGWGMGVGIAAWASAVWVLS